MEKIIYLEPDDEITTVVDKIRKATKDRVILVVPKAATILQSIVNLKLLKNEARKLGKEISIVTSDETGKNLATQVGLTVYRDVSKRPDPEVKNIQPTLPDQQEDTIPLEGKTPENEVPTPETAKEEIEKSLQGEEEQEEEQPSFVIKSPKKQAPTDLDIRSSAMSFKPYKDEKKAGIVKEIKKPFKAPPKLKRTLIIVGSILAALIIALGVLAYLFLPKADVEVELKATKVESAVELKAEKEAKFDEKNLTLPALEHSSEQEGSKNFTATGTKEVGDKASGTITAINETGVDQPLVVNTRFRASNGLIFRTNSAITVPKAHLNDIGDKVNGSINVTVTAEEAGEAYNIGATSFTIPGLSSSEQQKIYGRSSTAMSGGSTRTVKIVSQEDIDNAKKALTRELRIKAREGLEGFSNKEDLIVNGAYVAEIKAEKAEPALDFEAEEFTLSLTIDFNFLSVKKSEYYSLLKIALEKNISKDQEILEEELKKNAKASVKEINKEEGTMAIKVEANAPVVAKMSEEVTKNNIQGRSPEEATAYLKAFEEVHDVKVTLWPFFARKIPSKISRINLITSYFIEEDKPSEDNQE